jgi:hypothetical protein
VNNINSVRDRRDGTYCDIRSTHASQRFAKHTIHLSNRSVSVRVLACPAMAVPAYPSRWEAGIDNTTVYSISSGATSHCFLSLVDYKVQEAPETPCCPRKPAHQDSFKHQAQTYSHKSRINLPKCSSSLQSLPTLALIALAQALPHERRADKPTHQLKTQIPNLTPRNP